MTSSKSSPGTTIISEECEICLGTLSTHAKRYPLLCPESCGCNICFNCMSHLVKMKESTHNHTTKVMTLCPRCQNDISQTIEDAFLMRKVMKMQNSTAGIPDSELSAAELRFKYSITPEQIEESKQRLEKFQQDIAESKGVKKDVNRSSIETRKNDRNNNDFKTQSQNNGENATGERKTFNALQIMSSINCDLFQGIQDKLSQAEQNFLFDIMTSGDVEKLVQSCQIITELKRIHKPSSESSNNKQSNAEIRALRMAKTIEEQNKIEEVEQYLDFNPLPRLPKFVALDANFDIYAKHGKVIKFRDDGWDGSVSDAFARVYTGNIAACEEDGFVNGQKDRKLRENRVLVYAARKQAAAAGISVGDVVTHVDGNEFLGTAQELRDLINGMYTQGKQMFTMVLNAEQVTADALKDFAVELKR